MWRLRQLASICLLLLGHPVEAREPWLEIRSPHFVMVTNAAEERARSALSELEQFRYVLTRVLPDRKFSSPVPTQVYGFRDYDTFSSFLPRSASSDATIAGYFRASDFKNVIALDLSRPGGARTSALFHEYVHLFLSYSRRPFPPWFEEGLAEFYAATRFDDEVAEVGPPRDDHRAVLGAAKLPPLEALLEAKAADFETRPEFYALSWALVHYLVSGRAPEGQEQLARFLAEREPEADPAARFEGAMGRSLSEMEEELLAYLERGVFPRFRFTLSTARGEASYPATELSPAEVQHRWGELFLYTDRLLEARVCLDEARRLDPELALAYESLGIAHALEGNEEKALALLREAMERHGASAVGLNVYARLLLKEFSGPWVDAIPDAVAGPAIAALRKSLVLQPGNQEAARLLSFVYLVRGEHLAEAEAVLETALAIAPEDLSLVYLEGQLRARRGDYERARELLRRVVREADDEPLRDAARSFLWRMETQRRAPGR